MDKKFKPATNEKAVETAKKNHGILAENKEFDLDRYEKKGLVNGGSVILECSACAAPLIEILVVRPNLDIEIDYQAKCPHCGDKSLIQTIKGGVYTGHTDYTQYTSHDILPDGTVLFETIVGHNKWK